MSLTLIPPTVEKTVYAGKSSRQLSSHDIYLSPKLTPVVTWLCGHGRLVGEQRRLAQQTGRREALRCAVFSIFEEATRWLADLGRPIVDPGVTKPCVSGRKPNQRPGVKKSRSQRRGEGLLQVSRRSEWFWMTSETGLPLK